MSDALKVSIVTPSYNQGRFIEDAIRSVLDQDYPNFEHIIIDNCSTDGTIEILKKYPHLIWISEPDKGQSDALNKGFKMATGEIIGWLNADDYYLPGAFKHVANVFNDAPESDAIYGDYYFVDINGHIERAMPEMGVHLGILTYYRCYIPSTAFFFRKELVNEGFLLDESIQFYSMDHEFYLRLLHAGKKIRHTRKFMACFRWHGHNLTEKTGRKSPYWETIYVRYGFNPFRSKKLNRIIHHALRSYYKIIRGFFKLYVNMMNKSWE